MPRRRLGVVLLVPDPVTTEIDGVRRALGADVGRVAPHLTLVPPTNVGQEDVDAVLTGLRAVAARHDPVELVLGPVASFAPVSPVAYLEVSGPGLGAVHRLRQEVRQGPLDRPPVHDFVPHVTVLDEGDRAQLDAAVAALASYRVEVAVDLVHVLEEQRAADGHRRWHPVAGFRLGRPAVVGRGGLELTLVVADRVPFVPGPPGLVVLAYRGEERVGRAEARVRGTKAWLETVEVDEAVRGEGIGSHLLAALVSEAARAGAFRCFARAEPGSGAARWLTERGWAPEDPPPLVRDLGRS